MPRASAEPSTLETQEQSRGPFSNWRQAPTRHPRGHEKYPDGAADRSGGTWLRGLNDRARFGSGSVKLLGSNVFSIVRDFVAGGIHGLRRVAHPCWGMCDCV